MVLKRRWPTVPPLVWELLCAALLVALAAVHLRDPLGGRFQVSDEYDTLILQYPVHHALADALNRGDLPWWVAEAGNGLPLHAEGESGALFPPNLLLFGTLPPYTAYVLSLLLALAALGVGTFGFTRALGADRPAALLAGAALMLSGFAFGHEHHLSLLRTAALLPWLLWVAESHVRAPRWTTVGLGAVVVGLQWLAGNPQLAHLSTLTAAAYLPARAALETEGGARPRLRAAALGLAAAAAMTLVGMLAAAIQIVPSWLYADETVRAAGLSLADATVVGFPPRDLLLFLDPDAFGTPLSGGFRQVAGQRNLFWESVAYVGLVPLLLAPLAFVFRGARRKAVLLGSLAALGIAVALGRASPLYHALFAVFPGFDTFRVPQRWLLVTALALATLGALGLTELIRRLAAKWRPAAATALAFGIAAVGAYDVARLGDGYYPTLDRDEVERPSPTAEALGRQPLLAVPVRGPRTPPAAADLRGSGTFGRDALALVSHSLNVAWHVRSPLQYVGLLTRRSQHFEERATNALAASLGADGVSRPGAAWAAAVGATGARFVTSFVPLEAPGLEEAFRAQVSGFRSPVHVYRNLLARPRALLIADARDVRGEDDALRALFQSADFEPGSASFVEGARDVAVPPATGGAIEEAPGAVRVLRDEAMRLELDVDARRDAWLLVTDAPLAGWRAFLDGAETRVLPADVLCRAVPIPRGRHTVLFEYDPPGRVAGWALTGIGLAAIAGLFAAGLLRRKRKHSAVGTRHSA